jgi:hypothetical protein
MLDSLLLTTVSLGYVGYDSVDAVISGAKIEVAKTSVWGMTVVNSFESPFGSISQTAQNIYVVSPSSDDTMATLKWALHASDRTAGLASYMSVMVDK